MRFFSHIASLDELKTEYRRLCRIHHPDLGGDIETMKMINAEYEQVLKTESFAAHFASEDCRTSEDIEKAMREVIEKIIVLQGITLEICGTWLWITGNTYKVKEHLKAAGCFFARKKAAWYWKPANNKSKNKKPLTLEEIRKRHGTKVIKTEKKNYALN